MCKISVWTHCVICMSREKLKRFWFSLSCLLQYTLNWDMSHSFAKAKTLDIHLYTFKCCNTQNKIGKVQFVFRGERKIEYYTQVPFYIISCSVVALFPISYKTEGKNSYNEILLTWFNEDIQTFDLYKVQVPSLEQDIRVEAESKQEEFL